MVSTRRSGRKQGCCADQRGIFAQPTDVDIEPFVGFRIVIAEYVPGTRDVAPDDKTVGLLFFTEKCQELQQMVAIFGQDVLNESKLLTQLWKFAQPTYLYPM